MATEGSQKLCKDDHALSVEQQRTEENIVIISVYFTEISNYTLIMVIWTYTQAYYVFASESRHKNLDKILGFHGYNYE
jgi:hypothetical protein